MNPRSLITTVKNIYKSPSVKVTVAILVFIFLIVLWNVVGNERSDITVTSIDAYDVIERPATITGEADSAWFDNGSFQVSLFDAHGKILGNVDAVALSDWKKQERVPFQTTFSYTPSETLGGELVFYSNDEKLSQSESEYRLPVRFGEKKVRLYFLDATDPCAESKLAEVTRFVSDEDPITETLQLLLEGEVRADEWESNIRTQFPYYKFKLQNAKHEEGTLTLSFTQAPSFTSGSDCHINALRKQIEETALQFFSVRKVVFEGDILE